MKRCDVCGRWRVARYVKTHIDQTTQRALIVCNNDMIPCIQHYIRNIAGYNKRVTISHYIYSLVAEDTTM